MIEVESPCIGTCTLNRESVCVGCGRRLDEIAEWPRAFDPRKRRIVELSLPGMTFDINSPADGQLISIAKSFRSTRSAVLKNIYALPTTLR